MPAARSHNALLLLPLLAACGGGSGTARAPWIDPDGVQFTYGSAADASSSPALIAAAGLIQAAVAEATSRSDESVEYPRAMELVWSPNDFADGAFDDLWGSTVFPPWSPGCIAVQEDALLWDGCKLTETSAGDVAVTTLDGWLTRTSSKLKWDVTMSFEQTGSSGGTSVHHWTGELALSPASIVGSARSDRSSASTAVDSLLIDTSSVDLDLEVDADLCPVSGTLEVKELWAERSGRTDLPDRGALFTWSACGQATVSMGTR